MLRRPARAQLLVDTWLEDPTLPARVQELGGAELATMVRELGLEDAGPLLALVRPDQLLELFDEDLFHGEVGERERLDPERFATWLEVLLESGPASAAARFAALDEDFVAHALGGRALVLAEDELRLRLEQADEDEAHEVEQALESALELALDSYLLFARAEEGWDALVALVLALDQDHREFLERVLDALVRVGRDALDELDELANVLRADETLAEDVEAAREERRARAGYVEAQQARAFLRLARQPHVGERDPITRAYLRELPPLERPSPGSVAARLDPRAPQAPDATDVLGRGELEEAGPRADLREALLALPANLRATRTRELVYLANVLVAGATDEGERLTLERALEAASLTVELGRRLRATPDAPDPLRVTPADVLFRHASAALTGSPRAAADTATDTGVAAETEVHTADDPARTATQARGFLVSAEELAIWGAR